MPKIRWDGSGKCKFSIKTNNFDIFIQSKVSFPLLDTTNNDNDFDATLQPKSTMNKRIHVNDNSIS